VIVNGKAGLRPSLVAIDWSFVFDALDYGPPLGSAAGCGWAILAGRRSWYSYYSRSRPVARVAHGSSGRVRAALDPVVDKCRAGPGESRWWLVRIAVGGWLAPVVCHSSVSALPPALVWCFRRTSTTISSVGSGRVPRHLTPFGIRVGWGVALMGNVVRGSSIMRTIWRTGWMPEPPVWRSVRAAGKTKTMKARRTLALPTR
jgi:hypothetical protein